MPYDEVANLVTVTKTNMIDEMPCAYGSLHVANGPIYILLMYPMNSFQRMVTVGPDGKVLVYDRIPTEREETAILRAEGDTQRDGSYRCRVRIALLPRCLWRL